MVGRTPDEGSRRQDLYAAIDDAFDNAERVLQDHVHKQGGDTKPHQHQRRGRVSKLFHYEGYGFLETPEGDEITFTRTA